MDIFKVELSKQAIDDLERLPSHIVLKLQAWVEAVTHQGLREVRKIQDFTMSL